MKYLPMLLGLLFIGLKLTNNIDWSWVWVTSPFWIVFTLTLLYYGGIIAAAVHKVSGKK